MRQAQKGKIVRVVKILFNQRVITAVISAIGAIISAVCAGCRFYVGELAVKDFDAEVFSAFNATTNLTQEIKNVQN